MARQVRRDPFGRQTLMARRAYGMDCAFCGSVHRTVSGKTWSWQYYVETDGGRTFMERKVFCGLQCREACG